MNQVRIHRDLDHSRPINSDAYLPALLKGYRLTGISTDVFQGRDLQAWSTKQCYHRLQNTVYQPVLNLTLLLHENRSPTLDRLPPAHRQPDRAADLANGRVPASHEQR